MENALFNRVNYELFYIKSIDINKSNKTVNFKYTYPKDTIKEMKRKFNEKVNYILSTVIKKDYSDLEKELAIYKRKC
ncbi:hypothetical protein ACER0A_011825 [Haloimpatiens sp. FM7315]|uniref:hypothetical protein n=1 Tax=Haloimpatiens sp. FM7315 TaxID=3298609 RepID=UPI0035A3432D